MVEIVSHGRTWSLAEESVLEASNNGLQIILRWHSHFHLPWFLRDFEESFIILCIGTGIEHKSREMRGHDNSNSHSRIISGSLCVHFVVDCKIMGKQTLAGCEVEVVHSGLWWKLADCWDINFHLTVPFLGSYSKLKRNRSS